MTTFDPVTDWEEDFEIFDPEFVRDPYARWKELQDGKSVEAPMREGVDIGSLEDPKDLPNWKVAWTGKRDDKTIGIGVTTWNNPRPDVPIKFIRLSTSGTGAMPIVIAISLDPKAK